MAEFRERPYGLFNFLVDLGTGARITAAWSWSGS
jgi:hypothetical protein